MDIRALQANDRGGLLQIVHAAFRDDEIEVALELIDLALVGSRDYVILVAAGVAGTPDGIAGYVCFGPTPMTASTYDLYWIACHPNARRLGIAGALMQAMEGDLEQRGATGIRVETEDTEEYVAPRRLYERFGYPRIAHLRDFYREGAGLIVYYKRLS